MKNLIHLKCGHGQDVWDARDEAIVDGDLPAGARVQTFGRVIQGEQPPR